MFLVVLLKELNMGGRVFYAISDFVENHWLLIIIIWFVYCYFKGMVLEIIKGESDESNTINR